jgi:DNA repair exonuclease SbcCD ATPase subunit
MVTKWFKIGVLSLGGLLIVGGLVFGRDFVSYLRTSASSIRTSVKDSVPIDFELERARDMVEQVIPEIHANIRLIAQDEVEIAGLREDIKRSTESLTNEKKRIQKLADLVSEGKDQYKLNEYRYTHQQLKEELSHRFEAYKEAQDVLSGKQRLLMARENSLQVAMQTLDRAKSQKAQLETQIALLDGRYQMIKNTASGSSLQLDRSKLAQTEKVISEIKKRLDVAERVLAHEARFTQPIPVDVIDDKDLVSDVQNYFEEPSAKTTTSTAPAGESVQ